MSQHDKDDRRGKFISRFPDVSCLSKPTIYQMVKNFSKRLLGKSDRKLYSYFTKKK